MLEWCRDAFGLEVVDPLFFASSVGCVHGVELADGRQVVVKAFQPNFGAGYLRAVQDLQTALADAGLPAPRPLIGPLPLGAGLATAETMLPRPPSADGHDPAVRALLAAGLARFIVKASAFVDHPGLADHPLAASDEDALWPHVHDPRFDFAATGAGAEWIDRLARDALERRRAIDAPNVVGHVDWRVQNLGVCDGELVAIYDWDSVVVDQEPAIAANVAYGHCNDWSTDRQPRHRRRDARLRGRLRVGARSGVHDVGAGPGGRAPRRTRRRTEHDVSTRTTACRGHCLAIRSRL